MTKERLEEVFWSILSWGNDHDAEFRECLIHASGLTKEELVELELEHYTDDDFEDQEDE